MKEITDFLVLESIMNNKSGRLFTAYMIKYVTTRDDGDDGDDGGDDDGDYTL